jgi:hypothetical protein
MDRRSGFFLIAAIVCAALIPFAEPHRWVPIALSISYVVISAASWADSRTRRRIAADSRRATPRGDHLARVAVGQDTTGSAW